MNNKKLQKFCLIVCLIFSFICFLPGCESPEPEPFVFMQMCDTQLGAGGYQHDIETFRQAVKQINALKPDFVVICGDLVNNPVEKEFADFNKIRSGFHVPSYCAPGNHDILGLSKSKPYKDALAYYRKVIGKDYYSFEHKGYTFVIVNTQTDRF
jgi:serine/threonine-protein phosphatase CPPED1